MNKHKNFSTSFAWRGQHPPGAVWICWIRHRFTPPFLPVKEVPASRRDWCCKGSPELCVLKLLLTGRLKCTPQSGACTESSCTEDTLRILSPATAFQLEWVPCRCHIYQEEALALWPSAYGENVLLNNHVFKPLKCTFSYIRVVL